MSSSTSWISAGIKVLEKIQESQADSIERACRICAEAIGSGGLVHLFCTGHSRIPVEEMFPRYGSYPGFYPIVDLSMTFHTQVVRAKRQRPAMVIEPPPRLAQVILAHFHFRANDTFRVLSAHRR